MSSLRTSIPTGKPFAHSVPPPSVVDVDDLKLAVTMQQMAERCADSSRSLNEIIAKQIESGAVIDSPEYEFDKRSRRVRRRNT